jgi:hypothetical protein
MELIQKELKIQGRILYAKDIEYIKKLMLENPGWHRTNLSKEICKNWNWRKENGQLKDMACRSMLLKLEKLKYLKLPKLRRISGSRSKNKVIQPVLHTKDPINEKLKNLLPVEIQAIENGYELKLFKHFINAYHYLGWSGTVGENLKYIIYDKHQRPLGCMMFGAAAWKVKPRDEYIGWDIPTREKNLSLIANNNRFLILPWISVKYLASHILGKISKCINQDWINKYNHPVHLLETFVEKDRFKGTCYKAANWKYLGDSQGRGKLDRKNEYGLPVKSIWVYPVDDFFREKLCLKETG